MVYLRSACDVSYRYNLEQAIHVSGTNDTAVRMRCACVIPSAEGPRNAMEQIGHGACEAKMLRKYM